LKTWKKGDGSKKLESPPPSIGRGREGEEVPVATKSKITIVGPATNRADNEMILKETDGSSKGGHAIFPIKGD